MRDFQAIALRDHFRSFWQADPDCPVWLWAEKNIVLSAMESAAMSGPFSSAITPFIREPLECFRDDSVSEVTLVFATQVCKTLMIMLGVAWMVEHLGGRGIWVMDTETNARSFSETRWQPLVADSLEHLISGDRDDFKLLQQRLGNSLIHFVGSNSPGNLASRPADWVVCDELDKFAITTLREANALDNVMQRMKARDNTKIVKTSSPTTENGLIWKSYLEGDQRRFFVPCVACGEFQIMEFESVQWDARAKGPKGWDYHAVMSSARYHCVKCGEPHHDGMKTRMLREGEWSPTNPAAAPGVRSYHLSSLYSPWSKTSFGALAVEFLKHKARFDLKGWDNGYMARPSTETTKAMDWEVLAARRDTYKLGTIPLTDVALLTAFCDVQGDWLELFIWGWGESKESWMVEHHVIHGDPARPEVWDSLLTVLCAARDLPIDWTFIDYGGHHGQQAIEFVKRNSGRRIYLHKGSNVESDPVNGRVSKTKKPITRLFITGVGNAKRTIMAMLEVDAPGPGYCHFPADIDDEFFRQLCAEELRTKYRHGSPVEYWFQLRPRNEALDGFVGCYAGLKRLGQGVIRRRMADLRRRRGDDADKVEEKPAPQNDRPRRPSRPRQSGRSGWVGGNN
jgi:phage terminase large subunit GpA-like protein